MKHRPIIDAHVHVFPDALAPRAIANMERTAGLKLASNGTTASLQGSMRQAGITHAMALPVSTAPHQVASINSLALNMRQAGIIPFGSLHPSSNNYIQEIQRLKAGGIRGVKMHPDHQSFDIDAEALEPLYTALAAAGVMLVVHAGRNINLTAPARCTPLRLARVIKKFGELKIVAAHLGGWQHWDEVERYLVGLPFWMDTSFIWGYCAPRQIRRIIRRHGSQRILFGSDSPWMDQAQALAALRNLELRPAEEQRILWDNAAQLLNLTDAMPRS